ncbi:hypothetical protein V7x_20720 [Crateriforma conspicua]|uniref:Uncharacterized protein n=1 Tax=Crateriforma conspicua TaxID=2527996 RepID=A0A5C6FXZ2_9PLAN|nr:hypothetical protein V7x_20720 [Crateriforma conspicua]
MRWIIGDGLKHNSGTAVVSSIFWQTFLNKLFAGLHHPCKAAKHSAKPRRIRTDALLDRNDDARFTRTRFAAAGS